MMEIVFSVSRSRSHITKRYPFDKRLLHEKKSNEDINFLLFSLFLSSNFPLQVIALHSRPTTILRKHGERHNRKKKNKEDIATSGKLERLARKLIAQIPPDIRSIVDDKMAKLDTMGEKREVIAEINIPTWAQNDPEFFFFIR
jgi:hypothetical protein